MPDCDAVIVGTGPAGATAAEVLTSAGWSVIMLEKGRNHLLSLDAPFGPTGEISNDELKFTRRHFLGPDPLLEPRTYRRNEAEGDRIMVGDVNNLPSGVGGGGFHADGKLPRFREVDFHAASELGPIDGADLVDWPFGYDELEPYYAEAERIVGVAGDADANPFAAWRSGPYPMPPGADMYCAIITAEAATKFGYHPYRAPTGVNSVEYDGRPACNNCGFCAYYGCPIEAKGDPVAPLRHALQTGKCVIRPESYVTRRRARRVGASGPRGAVPRRRRSRARGEGSLRRTRRRRVRDAAPVVALGDRELVGSRWVQSHVPLPDVLARDLSVAAAPPPRPCRDPPDGRSDDHRRRRARRRDRTSTFPTSAAGSSSTAPPARRCKRPSTCPRARCTPRLMMSSMTRDCMAAFTVQGEDLPQPTNRIDLDPQVTDVWGFPAGRVTYEPHRHEIACVALLGAEAGALMREAGAERTFSVTSPPLAGEPGEQVPGFMTPLSRHIMGTARMGTDPAASVFDASQRLHDVDNVLCTDSSVFPTSTGYGPTLTIVALAIRAARAVAGLEPLQSTRTPPP